MQTGFKVRIVCTDNKLKLLLLGPIKTEHSFTTNFVATGEHEVILSAAIIPYRM